MPGISGKHFGIVLLLLIYFAAIFYIVPIFAPGLLEPAAENTAIYFAVTYVTATSCTFVSRLFYVSDVSFRFELAAGLAVAFLFFVLIGQPRFKTDRFPDPALADQAAIAPPQFPMPARPADC